MTKQESANYKELYELVDRFRTEIKQEMTTSIQGAISTISSNQGRLENMFTQETGRIKDVEDELNRLKVATATIKVKVAAMATIAMLVISSVTSVIVVKVLG